MRALFFCWIVRGQDYPCTQISYFFLLKEQDQFTG